MDILDKVFQKKSNLVARRIGEEYILVPVINNIAEMNKVYTLNEVGAFIWDQIDGVKTVREIIVSLTSSFEVEPDKALEDLTDFIKSSENVIIN